MNAAWWLDTLRPDHWRHWPDWWRDWRDVRRRTSRKVLSARVATQEAKMRELFQLLAEMTREAGMDGSGFESAKPTPERHLHLVRDLHC